MENEKVIQLNRISIQRPIKDCQEINSNYHPVNLLSSNQKKIELNQKVKMDRSQVREFGMSRSIYSSKLMGINSVLHSPRSSLQRDIHLRKSRITNIPDTRHIDLSSKLDMVVVFQTIQIQRLSEQIETLRGRLREYQRQLFNYDHYEIQIKELTEKCFRLESQKNSYRQELFQNKQASELIFNQLQEIKKKYITVDFTTNEKYKLQRTRNEQLILEVQKWKSRYHALDQSKSKQLQIIKKIMQQQSKSSLSRQTKQLFDHFESQKDDMQQLIKTLKQTNVEKQTQLKKLKFQLQTKQKLTDQMEKQVDQYQQKVALLSQQNYRLSQLSKSKQNQINRLKQKIKENQQITIRINQQILTKTEENKKIISKLQKVQQSINQKDLKLNKLQKSSLNDKQRLSQMDRIVFLLRQRQNQIQGKNKAIQRKDKKIIILQGQIKLLQEIQNQTKKEIQNLKSQTMLASQVISQLLQRIQKLRKLQLTLKKSAQQSQQKIQTRFKNFSKQVNQKTSSLIQYSNSLLNEINQNQQYIQSLQQFYKGSSQKIQVLQNEKIDALNKIQQSKQLQQAYRALQRKNEKLQTNIQRLIQQRDHLVQQNQIRQQQIMNQTQIQLKVMEENYQNNVIKNLKLQLNNKEKQFNQLKNQCMFMEKKLNEFQANTRNIQEDSKKVIQLTKIQWENKFKIVASQLNQKTQNLSKQKNISQELRKNMESFINFYESNVKVQIQAVLSRVQPLQKMIKLLKSFIFEKLVRQQQRFIDKQSKNEEKINELIESKMMLMQKNEKLMQILVSGEDFDMRMLMQDNQSMIKSQNQQNKPATIYTVSGTVIKSNNNNRTTNENFNSSNIMGMGSKIKQTVKNNFNNQTSTSIPVDFLIKHVILCAQLESLRQRIGDKNAKVEKMKNSLMVSNVSSNKSFVAIVNGTGKSQTNNVKQPQGEMMLESGLMSTTIINKLGSPFMNSVVRSINNDNSIIHQSRLLEHTERNSRIQPQLNIRRVISQDRFVAKSPQNTSVLDDSESKNHGIYTKRLSGGSGLGRNGFKSIGIKKSTIYN